jgi:hypothetical protein
MRARSLKRQQLMRIYVRMVGPFLADNPTCQFPLGCAEDATTVHHKRGRFGTRLIDKQWWAASCNAHNTYAETNTGHSLEIGWLIRIEGRAA